jgi:hypothetical protein
MKKDAFYFPHFSNARHDRKLKRVIKDLGIEGYGIYFMILEVLRDQQDFKYPMVDLDLLADEFGTSESKVSVVVNNYDLFIIDSDEQFFSPKMLTYLEPYFRMREQRKLAGKASADKRLSIDRSTTVQQSKEKESKGKEIKAKEEQVLNARDLIFEKWFKYKREKKQTYTATGKETLIKTWSSYNDNQLEQIIDTSISNNWAGLFPPKNNQPSQVSQQVQVPRTTIIIPDNY